MRRSIGLLVVGVLLAAITTIAVAGDAKDAAIKKDRKKIEGTWTVVAFEVDGNKGTEEDAKKLTVVNGADGTWSLHSEDKEMNKGTSTIDPTKKPKTIDFTITEGEGKGNQHLDGRRRKRQSTPWDLRTQRENAQVVLRFTGKGTSH